MSLKDKVKELLDNYSDVQRGMFHEEFEQHSDNSYYDDGDEFDKKIKEAGIGYSSEDHYGGEGQGEEYWTVYSFWDANERVYVKFNGWYASYNGSEFVDYFFVKPVEVMKIEWEVAK